MRTAFFWVYVIGHRTAKVDTRLHPLPFSSGESQYVCLGPKGVSCLLYRQSFAGTIELPVDVEVGDLIRLHRMKVRRTRSRTTCWHHSHVYSFVFVIQITGYKPESGCLQLKSSNYYSWYARL